MVSIISDDVGCWQRTTSVVPMNWSKFETERQGEIAIEGLTIYFLLIVAKAPAYTDFAFT